MDAAQGEPAVAIRQRDGEILRVLRDMGSDPLPADRAVLAPKVVIICRHRESTMARLYGKARPAGKCGRTSFPAVFAGVIQQRGSGVANADDRPTKPGIENQQLNLHVIRQYAIHRILETRR